jgi:hypothetical protein
VLAVVTALTIFDTDFVNSTIMRVFFLGIFSRTGLGRLIAQPAIKWAESSWETTFNTPTVS